METAVVSFEDNLLRPCGQEVDTLDLSKRAQVRALHSVVDEGVKEYGFDSDTLLDAGVIYLKTQNKGHSPWSGHTVELDCQSRRIGSLTRVNSEPPCLLAWCAPDPNTVLF